MKKPLILIVEDEEDIHEALKIILSANFELAHAYNGADGLKKSDSSYAGFNFNGPENADHRWISALQISSRRQGVRQYSYYRCFSFQQCFRPNEGL